MRDLFFDCSTGVSGDMLIGALVDLGVPQEILKVPLDQIGFGSNYLINILEDKTYGLRGKKVEVIDLELPSINRSWKDIKELILNSSWEDSLREKVFQVFEALAQAEASVHGVSLEEVHFHEIGAIDSIVDIVCVCTAIEFLKPQTISSSIPPAGRGSVKTSHGLLPVPVPAVLELAKNFQIKLLIGDDFPNQELTTPTGLALLAILSDKFELPSIASINSIGLGIGHRDIGRPNFLRVIELDISQEEESVNSKGLIWQKIVYQEAWIDDLNSEDISLFCDQLRSAGALEVICKSIQMKKNRLGFCITSIANVENVAVLRDCWFSFSSTIGLRERFDGRWVLPRRKGFCKTCFGKVSFKQIMRPKGKYTLKPEHDDLVRISKETGKSISSIREKLMPSLETFFSDEDWEC